jgi:hypothetical protein
MTDDLLLDGPVSHLRRMVPPWSGQEKTVCGRDLDDVAKWLPWEDAKALVNKYGRTRAQFLLCQTCLQQSNYTADTPRRWEADPVRVVADWAGRGRGWGDPDPRIRAELLALSDLLAAHREEYAEHLARRLTPDALAERRKRTRH